ncbi:N-acetylmuramoyl-L-alanine amidase [Helicobacter trogontum]|uniref:N-acetylmuramoyl-L-alanine amidase n=1 Tax=Helicobacter trogontum TaxID=50960 RepID=A0A4U8TFP8_9HELI|nr:N-acetylmuramoyl-L-alanine amidase [Helicobacter trogontum]MDY5186221.1 N-acetylmuramoyl-L-alanine amidase [Helicobacter trogontum]TLD98238.1 N-acetylmuramoyl-L-alanine amidase [Helicobacter trogontum]
MRCIVLFFLLVSSLQADTLRILNTIPFGASSLRIDANRAIKKDEISIHKLNDTSTFIDIYGVWVPTGRREHNFPNNTQITIAQNNKQRLRVLITLTSKTEFEYNLKGNYLYISIKEKNSKQNVIPITSSKKTEQKPTQHAKPTQQKPVTQKPQTSKPAVKTTASANQPKPILVSSATPSSKNRKKIIILDPGHGGKDCGTQGISKTCEKHIVLSVAKLTAQELSKRGYVVYMTRNTDVFIELQRRTEMANEIHADLFISIHANSIPVGSSRQPKGVETYFLSTARTERAINAAAIENQGMAEYSPTTIASFLTSQRIIASNKLGMDVQAGILKQIRTKYNENLDGGVREGPFWVLVGALMPSILIEIGYNSHPIESQRLKDTSYQNLIAKGIANGVDGYITKNP